MLGIYEVFRKEDIPISDAATYTDIICFLIVSAILIGFVLHSSSSSIHGWSNVPSIIFFFNINMIVLTSNMAF
jgi:hypothetical protein